MIQTNHSVRIMWWPVLFLISKTEVVAIYNLIIQPFPYFRSHLHLIFKGGRLTCIIDLHASWILYESKNLVIAPSRSNGVACHIPYLKERCVAISNLIIIQSLHYFIIIWKAGHIFKWWPTPC